MQFAYAACSTVPTIHNSFNLATDVIDRKVPGCFVECGVFSGSQCAAMALAAQVRNERRVVHMFDSFEGIPEAGPKDDHTITDLIGKGEGRLRSTGVSSCSLADVLTTLKVWGFANHPMVPHRGWFQDTVPRDASKLGDIAILRLDGDLYESNAVCLEHLHPLVSPGGYVIVDDWLVNGAKQAVLDYWKKHSLTPTVIEVPGGEGPIYYRV